MSRLLSALAFLLFAMNSPSAAGPGPEDVDSFHRLVETGDVAAVADTLRDDPALAVAGNEFGFQAIHQLDYIGFEEKLALLLEYGADIGARNDEGITLLHVLIDAEFLPVVMKYGADLEARDLEGRTPLLVQLAEPDNRGMIEALLIAGADPEARGNDGRSAKELAQEAGNDEIVHLLKEFGADR